MSDYRRSYIPGGCWFFTVNLQNRHSDLPDAAYCSSACRYSVC